MSKPIVNVTCATFRIFLDKQLLDHRIIPWAQRKLQLKIGHPYHGNVGQTSFFLFIRWSAVAVQLER